jgi:hypothetical protein
MKKIIGGMIIVSALSILGHSAEAAITIRVAEEVQDSRAFIKGIGATRGAPITWEGVVVTTANSGNGSFSLFGNLPDDCTGELSDGNETIRITINDCVAIAGLEPAPVAKTGQTVSVAPGDDGALRKGVPWPNPRFTDNNNGTVTDKLTGLIWLKNANCLQDIRGWQEVLQFANSLASGACGLSDGSRSGDWRVPNRNELASLLDLSKRTPALPTGHPFTNFQVDKYWTSTSFVPFSAANVWLVDFSDGSLPVGTIVNFRYSQFVRDGP